MSRLPRLPAIKKITPSSIAPGSRGPRRVRLAPIQPTYEAFVASSFKARYPRATYPEMLADFGLKKLGLKPGEDYLYQYDLGQQVEGGLGANVDFVVTNRVPWLALPVMGLYWHPVFGPKGQYDIEQFSRVMTRKGWNLIPLDEDDLVRDAAYTVRLAVVQGIDISRYRGRY